MLTILIPACLKSPSTSCSVTQALLWPESNGTSTVGPLGHLLWQRPLLPPPQDWLPDLWWSQQLLSGLVALAFRCCCLQRPSVMLLPLLMAAVWPYHACHLALRLQVPIWCLASTQTLLCLPLAPPLPCLQMNWGWHTLSLCLILSRMLWGWGSHRPCRMIPRLRPPMPGTWHIIRCGGSPIRLAAVQTIQDTHLSPHFL